MTTEADAAKFRRQAKEICEAALIVLREALKFFPPSSEFEAQRLLLNLLGSSSTVETSLFSAYTKATSERTPVVSYVAAHLQKPIGTPPNDKEEWAYKQDTAYNACSRFVVTIRVAMDKMHAVVVNPVLDDRVLLMMIGGAFKDLCSALRIPVVKDEIYINFARRVAAILEI